MNIRTSGKIASMALSRPGHTLAVVTEVPDVSIYCTYTGAQLFSQRAEERLRCVALDSSGMTVMWGGWNNKFCYVNAATGAKLQRINNTADESNASALIRSVASSADGRVVAVGGDEKKCDVHLLSGSKYVHIASFQREKVVWDVEVSRQGDLVALGDYDGCVAVYVEGTMQPCNPAMGGQPRPFPSPPH